MAGALSDRLGQTGRNSGAVRAGAANLLHMKLKPAENIYSRGGTAVDEIVLHGTESHRPQSESADYSPARTTREPRFITGLAVISALV